MTERSRSFIAPALTTSTSAKSFVSCNEGAGTAADSTGNGNTLAAAAGNDAAWGTAGFMSSKATAIATDGALVSPLGGPLNTWNSNTESLIIAFTFKGAIPAVTRFWGTSKNNSGGAATKGIAVGTVDASGQIGPRLYDGIDTIGTPSWSPVVLGDGNAHTLVWMLDGLSKLYYTWIDGVEVSSATSWNWVIGGLGNAAQAHQIGRVGDTSNATFAFSVRNQQIAKVAGNLPGNYRQLAAMYQQNPFRPWHDGVLP